MKFGGANPRQACAPRDLADGAPVLVLLKGHLGVARCPATAVAADRRRGDMSTGTLAPPPFEVSVVGRRAARCPRDTPAAPPNTTGHALPARHQRVQDHGETSPTDIEPLGKIAVVRNSNKSIR